VLSRVKADNKNMQIKNVRQLENSITQLRKKFQIKGSRDLETRGAICVTYNKRKGDNRRYCGQTRQGGGAWMRFQGHWGKGKLQMERTGDCDSNVDKRMQEIGITRCGVMVAEILPRGTDPITQKRETPKEGRGDKEQEMNGG